MERWVRNSVLKEFNLNPFIYFYLSLLKSHSFPLCTTPKFPAISVTTGTPKSSEQVKSSLPTEASNISTAFYPVKSIEVLCISVMSSVPSKLICFKKIKSKQYSPAWPNPVTHFFIQFPGSIKTFKPTKSYPSEIIFNSPSHNTLLKPKISSIKQDPKVLMYWFTAMPVYRDLPPLSALIWCIKTYGLLKLRSNSSGKKDTEPNLTPTLSASSIISGNIKSSIFPETLPKTFPKTTNKTTKCRGLFNQNNKKRLS